MSPIYLPALAWALMQEVPPAAQRPILPRRQWRLNLLYRIFVPVFMRNHCGKGRFMLSCFARCFFNLKVLTEPIARGSGQTVSETATETISEACGSDGRAR